MSGIFPENMKIVILLSSIALAALVSATQENLPSRSVNVALKTSFLFDPEDLNENQLFVNNIRKFLDTLNKTLDPQTAEKQFRAETKPQEEEEGLEEFIEVMQRIGQNFLNMTTPKMKETFDTIHVEVTNVTKKQHTVLRQVLLDSWLNITPEMFIKMKVNLTAYVNKPLITTFARRMNSYYNAEDVKELNKILKKFKRYIENNKDTTKIIKKLVHTVFNKYDNLNESAKAAVMRDLKMLSDFLVAKNSMTGPEYSRNSPSHEIVDKADSIPDDITYNSLRRFIDEKIWNAREKKEDNKKKDTNDVFVGNVELLAKPQNS